MTVDDVLIIDKNTLKYMQNVDSKHSPLTSKCDVVIVEYYTFLIYDDLFFCGLLSYHQIILNTQLSFFQCC